MFRYETPPSIKKEIDKLEGESPQATLSRLKEQWREIDDRDGPDNLSPDENAKRARLAEQIKELEESLHLKKAA